MCIMVTKLRIITGCFQRTNPIKKKPNLSAQYYLNTALIFDFKIFVAFI